MVPVVHYANIINYVLNLQPGSLELQMSTKWSISQFKFYLFE